MKKNKKILLFFILIISVIFIVLASIKVVNVYQSNKELKQEETSNLTYEIKMFVINSDYTYTFKTLFTVNEIEGIEKVTYTSEGKEELTVSGNHKNKIAFDFDALENKEYEIKIKPIGKEERVEKVTIRRKAAGEDDYKLVKGVWLNVPFLDNFNSKYTRYLTLTENDTMTPDNWIYNEEPLDWYDYKKSKWANLYVESEGYENYYVWIPRYVYKLDSSTQKSDIKFVDVYNNYKNADTGESLTYAQLIEQGYKLPEAFEFGDGNELTNGSLITSISGYWVSKYQLSEATQYNINYSLFATANSIRVGDFTNNVNEIATKYKYAINGEIENTTTELSEYNFENINYDKEYIINITALDENDKIVGSMTKTFEPAEINPPDLSKFNDQITYYVWYDNDGTEHNDRLITETQPENWYDYSLGKWANIVVKNDNGAITYYTWIPRYQYHLNKLGQRSEVKFIVGKSTETLGDYIIPEAFWWDKNDNGVEEDGEQLTGYWITKYQLVDK